MNDFWSEPKKIGRDLDSPDAVGNCGEGCTGWDNAWLVGKHDIDNEVPLAVHSYTIQSNKPLARCVHLVRLVWYQN